MRGTLKNPKHHGTPADMLISEANEMVLPPRPATLGGQIVSRSHTAVPATNRGPAKPGTPPPAHLPGA